MKKPTQKQFVNLDENSSEFLEPKIVSGSELPAAIAKAAKAGFWSTRLKVVQPGVYELRFSRMPEGVDGGRNA